MQEIGDLTRQSSSMRCTTQVKHKILHFIYLEGPPKFPKPIPGEVTGFLGKETKLRCDLLGNPAPDVQWSRSPPLPLPQGRSEVRKDGLYIRNTQSMDSGVYTCFATNMYGLVFHGTFLNVKAVGK